MCFFSSPKIPSPPPPPPAPVAVAPPPSPTPTATNPVDVAAQGQAARQRKIQQTRFGLASTIKTPLGVSAPSSILATGGSGEGKTTLG